jgi:hypothetical protein
MVHGWQRIDPDRRVNGRQGQRHVAHVGRGSRTLKRSVGVGKGATERFGVTPVQHCHLGIMAHLGIRFLPAGHLQLRSGGQRSGLKAAQHLAVDLTEFVQRLCSDNVLRSRVSRDDVRCIPTFCDDSVDTIGRSDMLPQQPDRGLRHR